VVRFTKYEHFFVIARHFIAQEIAQLFLDHVYKFHWLSVTIFTDIDKILTDIRVYSEGVVQAIGSPTTIEFILLSSDRWRD
jgi:hypothetical protein